MKTLVLIIVGVLLAPAAATAQPVESVSFTSIIPTRIDAVIGFIPTTTAIHPPGKHVVPITVRSGGRTHRYVFTNAAAVVSPTADSALRALIRGRRYPPTEGIFLDRRLTALERRYVKVSADLGRDADVLVVTSGHPACTSGVSRATARGIATGKIASWSAAGVPVPAGGDAIALRRAGTGLGRSVEPRFGDAGELPSRARAAADGGLSEAAAGNESIAAVTSWSRARAYGRTTCAVPIDGASPSDASVRALSHPDAYPIAFVTLRRLKTAGPIAAAFRSYLLGPQATDAFRQRGMLLLAQPWPAT